MIRYGVTTSKAHYWAHVCPLDGAIYYYPRRRVLDILDTLRECTIRSAVGRLLPIRTNLFVNGGIVRCAEVGYPFMARWEWDRASSDLEVGAMAEECFTAACKDGLFLLPVRMRSRYDARAEQFKGKDFACDLGAPFVDVEVKADIPGGAWGTGNLFVQTSEGTSVDGDKHDYASRNGHRGSAAALPEVPF